MFRLIITLLRFVLRNYLKIRSKIAPLCYRLKFFVDAALNRKCRVTLGKKTKFHVPVVVRNSAGKISIGKNGSFGFLPAPHVGNGTIFLQARNENSILQIGENALFSNEISIISTLRIEVGNHFLCGDQVRVYDSDFHAISPEERLSSSGESIPVKIGNNVWLGSRVMILKGVEIGDGSVIAAGSIVTKSIPPRSLAAGIPAKVIRQI